MENLQLMVDSAAGYLVAMALVETIIKPAVVRLTKKTLKSIDESSSVPDFVVPDWLYEEESSESGD